MSIFTIFMLIFVTYTIMLLKIITYIKDSSYSDSTDKGIKDCPGFPSVATIQKKT